MYMNVAEALGAAGGLPPWQHPKTVSRKDAGEVHHSTNPLPSCTSDGGSRVQCIAPLFVSSLGWPVRPVFSSQRKRLSQRARFRRECFRQCRAEVASATKDTVVRVWGDGLNCDAPLSPALPPSHLCSCSNNRGTTCKELFSFVRVQNARVNSLSPST
jgi:hypothetical protein